jgi:hypothetical protein
LDQLVYTLAVVVADLVLLVMLVQDQAVLVVAVLVDHLVLMLHQHTTVWMEPAVVAVAVADIAPEVMMLLPAVMVL